MLLKYTEGNLRGGFHVGDYDGNVYHPFVNTSSYCGVFPFSVSALSSQDSFFPLPHRWSVRQPPVLITLSHLCT